MPPTLLTPTELADALGASYQDVLAWTRAGVIPSLKTGGRHYYNPRLVAAAIRRFHRDRDRDRETSRHTEVACI